MRAVVALLAGIGAAAAEGSSPTEDIVLTPAVRIDTDPVPSTGDAADDPAIWIHPTHPEQSLVLGTDKRGGLHVYGMDGHERSVVSDGARPNNVDVLYGFRLGGKSVDL